MAQLGQASGEWIEGSSALRLEYVGVRNSTGVLAADGFTQSNPPIVTAAATVTQSRGISGKTLKAGVLGGSVAFTRPDAGSNYIGGPAESVSPANLQTFLVPLGCFINDSRGNPYENTPGLGSGKGPYVSSQGTFGNQLYETQVLDGTNITGFATGDAMTYVTGVDLIASRNGYLQPRTLIDGGGTLRSADANLMSAQATYAAAADVSVTLAVLKMPADSTQPELVYDQRI
jgi:hypothetical protein